jgi:hypothetical protein
MRVPNGYEIEPEANLQGANLRGANLQGVNLQGADLRDAALWKADLGSAALWKADLRDADLREADLQWADITDAKGIFYAGTSADGYSFHGVDHGDKVMVKAGCRWFSTDEARHHWEGTRGGTELGAERLRFVDAIEKNFNPTA